MVKSGFLRKMAISLSLAALGAGLSSCGLKNWWGEKPKGAPVINAFSNGSTCPEPMRILKGTEEQSSEAFECVATQLGQLWTQIEGEKKDTLSDDEIRLLVNRNVIAIEGDKAGKLHRLFEAKRLLGFGPSLERAKVEELLAFLRENRATLRAAYRKFIAREGRILYTDVRAAGNLLAALLRRLDWRMTSDELNRALQVFVEVRDPEIRDALLPTADFGINFLNMTCPQFVRKDFWNTRELADCAIALLEHFKGGAAWFEFLLNPVEDFSVGQGYEIANALKRLRGDFEIATGKGEKGLIQKWFGDPSLSTLKLDRLVRISQRLGASPPPKTLEALSIIRRFKSSQGTPGRSTEQELYPDEAIPFIFMEIIYPAQLGIIENLPHFVAAVKEGRCANPGAKEWTDCALTEFPWRQPLTSIDKVLRIKNLRHGQAAAPLNGRRLSKIMFFDAIASRAVDAFDKFCDNRVAKAAPGDCRIPDHYITLNISSDQNEYDEFLELLSAAGDVADTVGRFYDNIARKLRGLPLLKEDSGTLDPYRNGTWDRRGFARLIAMTSDILVQRPIAERNAAEMLLANLTNIFPANIVFLDQLSVTAIINLIDELPEYREAYLQFADARPDAEGKFINAHSLVVTQEPGTDRTYVDRASVIANLDKMMSVTFPRTYESCRTFLQRCDWRGGNCEISPGSFERSCGIALDEVLSAAIPGTGNISAGDLDLLTILAASMEAVIDSCNVSDGKGRPEELSWSLMDGNDELDCGFIKAKDVVKRLVESKILQVKGVGKPVLNLMLDFTSSTFLTRPMGKVAMIRGTLDGLLLNELTFWAYRKGATVGSLFALVSDIADPARAKELDRWEPQK